MQRAELIMNKEQLEELKEAANEGFARAQFNLGMCYEHGVGVEQDMAQAVEWYEKSAAQDEAWAFNNMAYLF